jgi:hypothetical protein
MTNRPAPQYLAEYKKKPKILEMGRIEQAAESRVVAWFRFSCFAL